MQNEKMPTEGQNSTKLEAESALRGAACYAIVDSFRDALKKGKLQQRIHDEWCDVDPEQIPVGYVARAHHWRIVPHNVQVDLPPKKGVDSTRDVTGG